MNIMSCHGYGLVDTSMSNLLKSRLLMNGVDHPNGLDGSNGLNNLLETSPSGFSQSSGEDGEIMVDGEVSATNGIPKLKIPKSVSFEDSDLSENLNPDTDILLWLVLG